jgi:hypothetical protein
MKEPKLTGKFEKAVADMGETADMKALLHHLGQIREAVKELQAEGLPLTMQVRPGAYKCGIDYDSRAKVLANGAINIGGTALDFAFTRNGGSMRFTINLGACDIDSLYLVSDNAIGREEGRLKKSITDAVLSVGAQLNLFDEFNIDETGRPGISTGKALSVSPPIKLKTNPKP